MLDLTRNLIRNSSLFNTIVGQLTTRVVSTCGGKVILSLPNEEANKSIRKAFYSYTRNVDFYTGDNFNHLLKRVLREYIIGGDVVLLFDDGLVEDSGKVLVFESNEIVNVSPTVVEERYGKGAWCSQGKVYNKYGRHIGTIVSKSQCGQLAVGAEVDPSKCYFLKKDPNGNPLDNYWFHFSCNWREGRGVSMAASAIATIHQLEDLVQSELLASRLNGQLFCWLVQKEQNNNVPVPMAFDEEDIESMTPEQIDAAAKEAEETERVVELRRAKECSVGFEQLPDGFEAQQVTTQHPNQSVEVMVNFLANRVAASMGLSRVFATGNPSDGDWRANQLFSFPTILEFQHDLEQVEDWLFSCFIKWACKRGDVKAYIAEDYMDYVSWQFAGLDDIDEVAHQTGIRLALENGTKTYKEILGADWKEKMEQTAFEHKWMSEHGMTHPSDLMLSGGQTQASKTAVEKVVEETEEQEPTEEL